MGIKDLALIDEHREGATTRSRAKMEERIQLAREVEDEEKVQVDVDTDMTAAPENKTPSAGLTENEKPSTGDFLTKDEFSIIDDEASSNSTIEEVQQLVTELRMQSEQSVTNFLRRTNMLHASRKRKRSAQDKSLSEDKLPMIDISTLHRLLNHTVNMKVSVGMSSLGTQACEGLRGR